MRVAYRVMTKMMRLILMSPDIVIATVSAMEKWWDATQKTVLGNGFIWSVLDLTKRQVVKRNGTAKIARSC